MFNLKIKSTKISPESWRRKYFSATLLLGLLLFSFGVFTAKAAAENIYVAQTAQGADTGGDCSNAHSVSWFNTAGNWAVPKVNGKIGPGDVVHLCGIFIGSPGSSMLSFKNSGSAGNPITLKFETGTVLRASYWADYNGAINTGGNDWIVIDGGTNGILESTANGSVLANQQANDGINMSNSDHLEIKNLTIRNLYKHTLSSDAANAGASSDCIYSDGNQPNLSIHDNIMHDCHWAIVDNYRDGDQNVDIYNNEIYNVDAGVVVATNGTGRVLTNLKIRDNHIHDMANWDTTTNYFHHDSIHLFAYCNGATNCDQTYMSDVQIYNNLFDGDHGENVTSHIFLEGTQHNVYIYNNVLRGYPGRVLNNGMIDLKGPSTAVSVYNNTMVGASSANGMCAYLGGTGLVFKNNIASTCGTLVATRSGTTFAAAGLDYNAYAAGGSNAFVWNMSSYSSTLATWRSVSGSDANSFYVSSVDLDGNWRPLVSSPVRNAGINLSFLGITALNVDKGGAARPTGSLAWDVGAYQHVAAVVTTYSITDFLTLAADWLKSITSVADLNADNRVNARDLGIMMSAWQ